MSYPPTPQRKACDCSDPCISTDDVYYAGPNLPNSGINTYNVLTEVIEKLDAIYAVPTLQRVTEMGNYTTLPIIADSFVKIGGDGTNLLLDNGTVLPIGDLPTGVTETSQLINDGEDGINPFITLEDIPTQTVPTLQSVTEEGDSTTLQIEAQGFIKSGGLSTEFLMADGSISLGLGYTPVNKAGDTMLGNLILNQDPSNALQAATKQYVDNLASGINFHFPVVVATDVSLVATYNNGLSGVGATLTGPSVGVLMIDGETPAYLDRILVWQQADPIQNGVYDLTTVGDSVTVYQLTRSSDEDNSPPGEIHYGDYTLVLSGDTNGGFGFICNTPGVITIGVTPISYIQFNSAQAVTAGYGLEELNPNVISIDPAVTQEKITLTTTGSGAATLVSNTLNIPQADNYWTKTGNDIYNNVTGGAILARGGTGGVYDYALKSQIFSGSSWIDGGFSVKNGGNVACAYLYPSNIEFTYGGSLFIGGGGPSGPYLSGITGSIGSTGTSYWKSNIKIKYTEDLSTSYDDRTLVDKGYITSYTASQLAGKMNIPSLTASYIPKALTATTIGNSRLLDTGTYLGIGTVNTPTKDITLGNQNNREFGIELSSNTVVGRDLKISSGSTINYIPDTGFLALPNSNVFQLLSIATAPNGDVLAMGYGGSMYLKTPGIDAFNFISGSLGADFCKHIITPNNDVYVTSNTGSFIKKQTNRTGSFITVATGSLFTDVTGTPSNDVWACSTTGVFKQTNATGSFVDQGFPVRAYQAITSDSTGKIYVAVYSGDIYEIVSGVMTALNQTYNTWSNIKATPSNNVIATTGGQSLYTRTSGVGNFIASAAILPSGANANRSNLAVDVNSSLYYVTFSNGPVYFQNNDVQGTSNLSGGTVNITAGTGKGTGASNFEVYTGQKLASGTDMQTSTLRARINNEGLMTLPSVTNALIEADTTGKALVTKEYVNNKISTYKTYFVNSVTGNNTTGVYQDASKPFATIDYVLSLPEFKDGDIIFLVYVYNYVSPTVYPLNGQIPDKSVTIKSDGNVQLVFSANNNANLYLDLATVYIALTIDLPRGQIINERNGGSGVITGINSGNIRISVTADYVYLNTSNPLFVNLNGGMIDIKIRSMAIRTTLLNGSGYVGPIIINEFNCLANNASVGIVSDQIVTISRITGVGSYLFRAGRFNVGDITTIGTCTTAGISSETFLLNFMNSTITSSGGFEIGAYYGAKATITGRIISTPSFNYFGNDVANRPITLSNFSVDLGPGILRLYGADLIVENCNIKSNTTPFSFAFGSTNQTLTLKNSTFQMVTPATLVTGGAGQTCTITISGVSYNATTISDQDGTGVTVNVIGKQVVANGVDSKDAVNKGQLDNRLVVETTSGYTLTNADSGGIVIFTASATLTIPIGLADGFECTFVTLSGVTLTVVSTGNTLNNATSTTMLPQLSFTLKRMLAANTYIATGNL